MSLRKYIFGSLFSILLFALYSCQQNQPTQNTNILRIQVNHEPDVLNPALSRLSVSTFIESMISLPLATWNNDELSWVPVLIEAYDPHKTDDGVEFVLNLRPEAEWSDGQPLTGNDVMYTLKMGLNPYISQQSWAAYLDLITTVHSYGDSLVLFMETPYILADEFIAGISPYPAHVLDPDQQLEDIPYDKFLTGKFSDSEEQKLRDLADAFNNYGSPEHWPVPVSGLYEVYAWSPEQTITLSRVKDSWIKKVEKLNQFYDSNIDTLQYVIIPDPQNALHAFTSGSIDVLNTMDHRDSSLLASFSGRVHEVPTLQQFYIAVNHRNPLLGNVKIRQALNMAINRQDLIDRLFHGFGQAAYGPIHPDKGYYSSMPVAYDPEQARQLLHEAGCRDTNNDGVLECPDGEEKQNLSFHIWTTRSELSRNVATLIKGYWQSIGVNLEIQSADFRSFLPKLQDKTYEFATLALRQNNLLDDPYPLWHSSQADATGKNYQALENDSIDHTLEQLRGSVIPAEQIKYYYNLQALFDAQTPVFFLVAPDDAVGVRKGVDLKWSAQRPGYDLLRSKIER